MVDLALVESELLALEDVAIGTAGLAGAGRDDGVETTGLELLLESTLNLARGGEASGLLLLDALGLLDLLNGLALLLLATTAEELAVVVLVPLTERSSVNLDNGRLGQGVGTDELVVGRVVCCLLLVSCFGIFHLPGERKLTGDHDHTGLAGDTLGGPGKVTRVETEGTILVVAATGADGVDALGTDTGVRRLTTRLEGSLLPCRACQKN